MRKLLIIVALWAGFAGAVWARTIEEQLFANLRAQGYVIVEQGYTFLGRLRVLAQLGDMRREIVINPGTGEILRDYAFAAPEVASAHQAPGNGTDGGTGVAASVASSAPGTGVAGSTGTGVSVTDGVAGVLGGTDVGGDTGYDLSVSGTGDPTTESTEIALPEVIIRVPILPLDVEQP